MEHDAHQVLCKCLKLHVNLMHTPTQELKSTTSLWNFSYWRLDLVGKIHPQSSNRHKFIITTTKYFTKWIKVIPLTNIIQIEKFILKYIIFFAWDPFNYCH